MPHTSSFRNIVITLILTAFAVIAVSSDWGSSFGFSQFVAAETVGDQEDFAAEAVLPSSEARPLTTPLNAITTFDAALNSPFLSHLSFGFGILNGT